VRSAFRLTFFPSVVALGLGLAAPARADVSSWLFTGFGASLLQRPSVRPSVVPSLQIDTGLGTSPANALAVGGLLRMQTRFGEGTDFGLLVRTATRGYVRGDWGAAVDLGGYLRKWGDGSPGLAGSVSFGAPFGITLNADVTQGPSEVRTFAAVLGLDFARFTVYRSTGLGWWPNPYPSPPAAHPPLDR
jgi:hypothetical protein